MVNALLKEVNYNYFTYFFCFTAKSVKPRARNFCNEMLVITTSKTHSKYRCGKIMCLNLIWY